MKKLLSVILFTFFLLLSACTHKEISQNSQTNTIEKLTLIEAIELAYSDALKWDEDAKLMNAKNINNEKETEKVDGKSRCWDVTFGIPGTYEIYWVNICDGKINDHADISDEDVMPLLGTYYIMDLSKIKFDSTELLKKAIETKELHPSDTSEKGYTYKISKNADEDIILIQIIGWDEEENVKGLQFDASTGDIYKEAEGD